MSSSTESAGAIRDASSGAHTSLAVLGVLAVFVMLPVTLPVPVLRELVQGRFAVSEFLTSLFMSVNMVGAFFAAPLAGALVDRHGRARAVLAGALVLDAMCFALLAAPISFPVFMAIRLVEGAAHISALSVLLALASRALGSQHRGRAMGIVGGAMMFGIASGAPLGGVLGTADPLLPLQVGAGILFVGSIMSALAVRGPVERRSTAAGLVAIGDALRSTRSLAVPLAFAFVDRFTVGFFTTTLALYTTRMHGLSPAATGGAIAVFMIPFALCSYPFGRLAERVSVVGLVCVGSLLYGLGTAAIGFTGPPHLYVLMFAVGTAAAAMLVPSMLLATQLAPEEHRATALGAFNAAGSLGFIVGPIVGGAVSQGVAALIDWEAGYRAAFIVAGAAEILCVAIALPFLARIEATRLR